MVQFAHHRDDRHGRWNKILIQRRHTSIASIAVTNKTARIAWALLRYEERFNVA